jgi:hypothetical protein
MTSPVVFCKHKFTLLVPAGGPLNLTVDVQGYFTVGSSGDRVHPGGGALLRLPQRTGLLAAGRW